MIAALALAVAFLLMAVGVLGLIVIFVGLALASIRPAVRPELVGPGDFREGGAL